jgi:hypothetical protein
MAKITCGGMNDLEPSDELRLYNLVQNMTISNHGLKAVSSYASLG